MRGLLTDLTIAVVFFGAGMLSEAKLLGDPHPFAWGHAGIGTSAIDDRCSDDDGQTWWPARYNPDGSYACFDADKPSGLGPFSIVGRTRKGVTPPQPAMGFGEASK